MEYAHNYDGLTCQECEAPHMLDCVIPSEIWNQIADPSDMLCVRCIDKRVAAAGFKDVEARFYFLGSGILSYLPEDERNSASA